MSKTQDLPKARDLIEQALQHPTTFGKDCLMREALTYMKKTISKQPIRVNESSAGFKARVIAFLATPEAQDLQDVEIAIRCGATAAAAARVSEYRNHVR